MVTFPRLDDPGFSPRVDPLTREFQDDQYEIEERERAQEGPGRFAEPRIMRRVEDVEDDTHPQYQRPMVQEISTRSGNHAQRLEELSQELFNRPWADLDDTQNRALWNEAEYRSGEHYRQIAPQGRSISTRESDNVIDDREIAADAIIQAAQDLVSQGWEPTRWSTDLLRMPEQKEEVPTLGGGVSQPVRSPVPGIAVDNTGRQYPVENAPPLNTVQAVGAGAVLNVPLAATGFALTAHETIFQKFPELVDMLASGKYRTDDPEIISRATDVAGIVTSGSFANRVAQEAGRSRQQQRTLRSEETGEPFYRPDDITLNINSTRDGRFNVDATVGGEQAVDIYVRKMQTRHNDPNAVLQFGHAYIDPPWQRQGIATAIQDHLEAITGKPFIPDDNLTQSAFDRWRKIDPDAVAGHVRQNNTPEMMAAAAEAGEKLDPYYYLRSQVQTAIDFQRTGTPWTETARMAEVRRAHAAGELESPLGPNGEFTLRGAQQTPKTPVLGMGAATDQGQGGGARPRNLDRAGYYSHAEETVGNLQQRRGTPQQMWASIEKQIKEPEIRQLSLDDAVLGPALAGSRRFVVDQTADLARLRQELKELKTEGGQARWVQRQLGGGAAYIHKEEYLAARNRQAELERTIPVREEALRGHRQRHEDRMKEISGTRASVNRDDILAAIQERRPQIRESNYAVYQRITEPQMRDARTAMAGPNRDWTPFMNELISNPNWTGNIRAAGIAARMIRDELDAGGKHLRTAAYAIANHLNLPNSVPIYETIKKLTGRNIDTFTQGDAPAGTRPLRVAKATLDPANPTLRWRTLSVQGESNSTIENLWRSIPDTEARTLRAVWGRTSDEMAGGGFTRNQLNTVEELRKKHGPKLDRIRAEETRGNFIDPHFEETNIFGHYASSLQRLPDGGTTLTVSQAQSTWFDKIRAGKNLPEHGLVANQEAWLDPVLRRIIKDAVDQGASSITLPSAETVFRYNPPGDARAGLVRFYNETVPRRLRAMMREIDDGYTARGDGVNRLHTLEDASTQYRQEGQHSGTVARIGGEIEDVRHGFKGNWLRFDLTSSITRYHRQGRGMRLQSAGVPVTGEEDGSEE